MVDKKLKCWKKLKRTLNWHNLKNDTLSMHIGNPIKKNKEGVIIGFKRGIYQIVAHDVKTFDTKFYKITNSKHQAIKFAKSYMKNHDKC